MTPAASFILDKGTFLFAAMQEEKRKAKGWRMVLAGSRVAERMVVVLTHNGMDSSTVRR